MTKRMVCVVLLFCAAGISANAQIFNSLASFDVTNGSGPYASLVQGFDGNLYGTTLGGGSNGYGTIFQISSDGALTILHSFDTSEGYTPQGALALANNGELYGTTYQGGPSDDGTIFQIAPGGELTTLYSFCSQPGCVDGSRPYSGLIQAADGTYYGTTYFGGANYYGTVFRITSAGSLTTLYSFCSQQGCADGVYPAARLIQARNGNFYGTTAGGGSGSNEPGTVFKISPEGNLTTLYTFCAQLGCADGTEPLAGLIQGTDGNFFGTTYMGGGAGDGTVFEITPGGHLTTLHSFCLDGNCLDGANPVAGLVQATNGILYGATQLRGTGHNGTIFEMTPGGNLTTIYSFCAEPNCADGSTPYSTPVQATDGILYGTTFIGGTSNEGTVYSLSAGLDPFVETLPGLSRVDRRVIILGNNLTGSTAVSFNGTAATFTVVSDTEITATVPAGATTGFVTVATPGGTLTSNKKFGVVP